MIHNHIILFLVNKSSRHKLSSLRHIVEECLTSLIHYANNIILAEIAIIKTDQIILFKYPISGCLMVLIFFEMPFFVVPFSLSPGPFENLSLRLKRGKPLNDCTGA